uniref:Protein Smaug n=1 Tax=Anopheles atroparvus TaxID=41427 RepID=A0AAG5DF50_ANOAO
MKYPGGNPSTMFCEQVGTVTSLFEQWNDCERTVVLYALLKRVPFANLKFLQVSIDYNLAQNYSTQSKLQQLETKANSTALLSKLVQKYYRLSGHTNASASLLIGGPHLNNNNNTHSVNNNLKATTESSSLYDLLKTSVTGEGGVPVPASDESPSPASSSSSRSLASTAGTPATITVTSGSASVKNGHEHNNPAQQREPETMEDILKDILMYLPLLVPGNDEAKSMYMSLIPAAVDDACRQLVPTEIVQQTLSYLLIHPAITNDDRRVLSHWLRYLEDFISTSYLPPASTATITKNRNFFNLQQTSANGSGNNNGAAFPATGNTPAQQFLTTSTASGGSGGVANSWNSTLHQSVPPSALALSSSHPSSTHSLNQPPMLSGQSHHLHAHGGPLPMQVGQPVVLSKSQQSLNQTTVTLVGANSNTSSSNINSSSSSSSSSSSTTSSSSCLDSAASQLLKCTTSPRPQLDWTAGVVRGGAAAEDMQSTNEFSKTIGQNLIASSQALIGNSVANGNGSSGASLPGGGLSVGLSLHNQQSQGPTSTTVTTTAPSSAAVSTGSDSEAHHDLMAATESLLYDSTDDHHISFSKNGTEIFDYDCDFENEDEFNYFTRNAAALRAAAAATTSSSSTLALSASAGSGGGGPANGGKKLVSFNSNVSDFLRVPSLPGYGHHHHHHLSHGIGDGGGALLDLDLDGTLMKTRRSNSLTTPTTLSALGGVGELLNPQQKQNNECLSAENLSNLQLLQNKPRSFSLTMESPRSSLASSGSDTQLDDYKQGSSLMKLYGGGPPNIGMSSIAHWLKSLRLHKYVWLFSNLTYDKMLGITEEYLQSLGVTKGARHKLAICIQKLKERYGTLLQLEKDLIAGQKAHLGTVLEELTNIVLTPMKPIGMDQQEDIAGQFAKVLDLVGSIILMRPVCSQQDEEYLNIFLWIVERALHNDAFLAHSGQMKDHKYKVSKIKMQLTPKGHFVKNTNVAGPGINKPRWSVNNKHKPANLNESQTKPHRKSSIPYFVPPGHANPVCQPQSQTIMQATQAMAHQYFHHGNNGSGTANYNKSSSYPSFASTLHNGSGMKPIPNNNNNIIPSMQQQPPHQGQQQHPPTVSTQVPPPSLQHPPPAMQHPNFMFHRHSLSNITHHNAGPLVPPPPIFLTNLGGPSAAAGVKADSCTGKGGAGDCGGAAPPNELLHRPGQSNGGGQSNSSSNGNSSNNSNSGNSHNSSIVDINSRLEFLCRQMTEQAIN